MTTGLVYRIIFDSRFCPQIAIRFADPRSAAAKRKSAKDRLCIALFGATTNR